METNQNVVDQVNKIIQTNLDRREGYEKAIDEVKDESLKAVFEECCRQSNENVNELRTIVLQNGGTPVDVTSTSGDLYRVWMDIKTALSANNSKAVLQSCEKGEDIALNAYRNVTESANGHTVAEPVLGTLNKQKEGIRSMHNKVKALRDQQS
jgi:uncharacterized protein (TIGR02284 family)